ncbi:MAG: ribose 5-phosphate isomerase B [Acidimicrobiia bacterium]|nr:ribose 5-phosphate isomerase B [Acidimicrobiia bacterium]
MKVSIAADHAGFALKQKLRDRLVAEGHQVTDLGPEQSDPVDYPDYALAVAREVAAGRSDRGILVCSSGVGMSIAANKVRGVRAALGTHAEEVRLTRAHNDANVLAIGAKFTAEEAAREMVDTFLNTEFEGGRHARRVAKITLIEQQEEKLG